MLPDDEHPYSPEWDEPAPPDMAASVPASRKAATWLWVLSGLQFLFGGCCGLTLLIFHVMGGGIAEQQAASGQMSEEQLRMLLDAQPYFRTSAILMFVFVLLPGILYLPLGFGVLRRHRRSVRIAKLLVLLQIGCVGYILISGAIASAAGGSYGLSCAGLIPWLIPGIVLVLTHQALRKVET